MLTKIKAEPPSINANLFSFTITSYLIPIHRYRRIEEEHLSFKVSSPMKGITEPKIESEPSKAMPSSSFKKKYKGVRMRSWGSWVSEIRAPNQKTRIWLGSYSTPEAAARAYDAALLCLKGSSANLNFPISSSQYLPDTILSPKSIQRVAAAAAANSFPDNANPPPPLSPFSTSTSSSSTSSPLLSSSTSNHIEDDVLLAPSHEIYVPPIVDHLSCSYVADEPMCITAPWYNVVSPTYIDMLSGVVFDPPPMIEDAYEEGDIRLWSFC
ncbi:unnamed protein product [Ilex paraguariensis]|uniref:AP2/ERF domain-containing protein n=1 Tax=Ilex paraguariensis TaxID=185542 RepID=A0ABC8QMJ8_9AQUA